MDRLENTRKVRRAIDLATRGDKEAAAYLVLIAYVARVIDDLRDGDSPTPPELVERMGAIFFVELPLNAFYRQHRERLDGAHVLIYNAWQDSNRLELQGGALAWNYSRVLRDLCNELLPLVACLLYGYDHMRGVSEAIRGLFLKDEFKAPEGR